MFQDNMRNLSSVRSNGTTLISYYIPTGSQFGKVRSHITRELSTSQNIKSKSTRKEVQSALRSIQSNLTHIPRNGLAIFASSEQYI